MRKVFVSLLGAALGLLILPVASHAMTVSPPNYDYTSVNRGDVIMDVIKLTNEGDTELTVYPQVKNFTFTEGDEGSGTPRFYDADKDPYGTAIGRWVKMELNPITLPPGGRTNVPFAINVPGDANPGGHFGGVIFATQPPNEVNAVNIGGQIGVLMMMRVEGDVKEAGVISEFGLKKPLPWYNYLPVDLFVRFENNGNVHLRPVGNVFVRDMTGRQVASLVVNENFRAALPGSIRRYDLSWAKTEGGENKSGIWNEWNNFAFGKHTARLVLLYGADNKMLTSEVSFYVWPWRLMTICAGALLVLLFLLTVGKRAWERSIIRRYEGRNTKA